MTTTFALTIDVLAFSVRQVFQQVLQSALAPIGQFGGRGHSFDLLNESLTDELGPVAVGAVQVRNRANVGAAGAVFVTARFLVHLNMEATVLLLALAAADTETAQTTFFWQLKSGRSGNDAGNFAFVVQVAMILEAVDNVGHGEPQALAPFVGRAESRAILSFLGLHAFSSIFVGLIRVAAAFATTVFLDAIAFGHIFQEFLERFTAPVGNIRTVRASLERFREQTPAASDNRSLRQIANLAKFSARLFFAIDRQASFLLLARTATELETALTALLGNLEAGRHEIGESVHRGVIGGVQFDTARLRNIVTHIVEREPEAALSPSAELTKSRTFVGESAVSQCKDQENRIHFRERLRKEIR